MVCFLLLWGGWTPTQLLLSERFIPSPELLGNQRTRRRCSARGGAAPGSAASLWGRTAARENLENRTQWKATLCFVGVGLSSIHVAGGEEGRWHGGEARSGFWGTEECMGTGLRTQGAGLWLGRVTNEPNWPETAKRRWLKRLELLPVMSDVSENVDQLISQHAFQIQTLNKPSYNMETWRPIQNVFFILLWRKFDVF